MENDDKRRGSAGTSGHTPGRDDGTENSTDPDTGRREPVFSDFDEEEDYEESDRDTDYVSAYEEEEIDDEDYDQLLDADEDDEGQGWQAIPPAISVKAAGKTNNPWDVSERGSSAPDEAGTLPASDAPGPTEENEQWDDTDDDWDEQDDYPDSDDDEDDYVEEPDEPSQGWPLGMIAVALVALLLLAAGGYGVIQQRAAMEEEIRQLQATLATSADPTEVLANREALRNMEQRNLEQLVALDALKLENRRLADVVAGLELQLEEQQSAPAKTEKAPVTPAATVAPKPVAKPKPPAASAAAPSNGDWFVNFSSYSQRSVAESWVKKLKPLAGSAVVAPGSKDGKTFYRVRVVGLASRAEAEKVSRELQSKFGLPKLWVGMDE